MIFSILTQWLLLGLFVGAFWFCLGASGRKRYVVLCLVLILGTTVFSYFLSRAKDNQFTDPSGSYMAVVTKRRYQDFIQRMPGDGGGASGFVEIFGPRGESFGRIPVVMVQYASQLEWTSSGAVIPVVGEWDFKKRTCYYWSDDQDHQIWVRR